MSKIKILIMVLIELGIIALCFFLDFKLPLKLGIFILGTFILSLIVYCIIDEKYVKKFEIFVSLSLGTLVFYIAGLSIVNPHYDNKIEKYNPTQIIRLKNEIILIGKTTSINSNKLKDYTLDNPKFCKETYFNAVNRKITSDYYICE